LQSPCFGFTKLSTNTATLSESSSRRYSSAKALLVGVDEPERLLAVTIVVDLARALQRDLVVREFAALRRLRSLFLWFRLGGCRRRDLLDIGGVGAADWSDHKVSIGRERGIFSNSQRAQQSLVRVTGGGKLLHKS